MYIERKKNYSSLREEFIANLTKRFNDEGEKTEQYKYFGESNKQKRFFKPI